MNAFLLFAAALVAVQAANPAGPGPANAGVNNGVAGPVGPAGPGPNNGPAGPAGPGGVGPVGPGGAGAPGAPGAPGAAGIGGGPSNAASSAYDQYQGQAAPTAVPSQVAAFMATQTNSEIAARYSATMAAMQANNPSQ